MSVRPLLAALLVVALGYVYAPRLDVEAFAPGTMPANLAAYEMADEPDFAKAKLATMQVKMPHGTCSGTAIGPTHYRVLTAKHCIDRGTDGFILGGRTAIVTDVEEDLYDAVILTTDIYVTHIASYGPKPTQGDIVFSHGNPSGTPDMLLTGTVYMAKAGITYKGSGGVKQVDAQFIVKDLSGNGNPGKLQVSPVASDVFHFTAGRPSLDQ